MVKESASSSGDLAKTISDFRNYSHAGDRYVRGLEGLLHVPSLSFSIEDEQKLLAQTPISRNLDSEVLKSHLRWRRHFYWVRSAVATTARCIPTKTVCETWSTSTRQILQAAWSLRAPPPAGLFALGKLGVNELNLSSDIDLVFLASSNEESVVAKGKTQLQWLRESLADHTSEGFCYRLDFDLRPGGRLSPILQSYNEYLNHYRSQLSPWERVALWRLTPVVGTAFPQDELMAHIRKLNFRPFVDFNLLEELNKNRLNALVPLESSQLNLKLNPGGIRDLELLVYSLGLVHAAKFPGLRKKRTDELIVALAKTGMLTLAEQDFLEVHYWELRHFENLLQAQNDLQTHLWKDSNDQLQPGDFHHLQSRMASCQALIQNKFTEFLARKKGQAKPAPSDPAALFPIPVPVNGLVQEWKDFCLIAEDYPQSFAELLKPIFQYSPRWSNFLVQDPRWVRRLAEVLVSQERFGLRAQGSFPQGMGHSGQQRSSPMDQYLQDLFEYKQIENLLACAEFLHTKNIHQLSRRITQTADAIVSSLMQQPEFQMSQNQIQILALGKWGGRELAVRSDLDFVFVADGESNLEKLKLCRKFLHHLSAPLAGGQIFKVDLRLRPTESTGVMLLSSSEMEGYLREKAFPWERQAYLKGRWLLSGATTESGGHVQSWVIQRSLTEADIGELQEIRERLFQQAKSVDLSSRSYIKQCRGGLLHLELLVQQEILRHSLLPKGPCFLDHLAIVCARVPSWADRYEPLLAHYEFLRLWDTALDIIDDTKLRSHFFGLGSGELDFKLKERIKLFSEFLDKG